MTLGLKNETYQQRIDNVFRLAERNSNGKAFKRVLGIANRKKSLYAPEIDNEKNSN